MGPNSGMDIPGEEKISFSDRDSNHGPSIAAIILVTSCSLILEFRQIMLRELKRMRGKSLPCT